MSQDKCLGFTGNDKTLSMQSCERPDSWKLLSGSQPLAKADNKKAPSAPAPTVGQIKLSEPPDQGNAGSPPPPSPNAQSSAAPAPNAQSSAAPAKSPASNP
jgi:hypothetical protein